AIYADIVHKSCVLIKKTLLFVFFFFQAEDGIRDKLVTGVQTCALPISLSCRLCPERSADRTTRQLPQLRNPRRSSGQSCCGATRSEERRVGKECRSRGWREQ